MFARSSLLFSFLLLSLSVFGQIEGDYATSDSKAHFGGDTRAWFRRSHPETEQVWQLGLDFKAATDVPVKVNVMYYPLSHITYPARATKWEEEGQPWLEFTVRDRPSSRDFDWDQDILLLKPEVLEELLPDSIAEQVLEEVVKPLIAGEEVYLFWEGENRSLANEQRSDSTEVRTAIRWGLECFNYYLANGQLPAVPELSTDQAVFVAHPSQTYGLDPVNLLLPSDYPEAIIQDSVPYRLAWKSQLALGEPGAMADSLAFELEGIPDPAALSLGTPLGSYPVVRRGGSSFGVALPPQPEGQSQAELLYTPDADSDPVVMGLLNVLAYAQESRTVHVIPVSQERPDGVLLQAKLNEIYGPAITDWTVQVEPVWNNVAWDKDERWVNLDESGLLTAYPPELKDLIRRYSRQFSYNPDHYYLFLVKLADGQGDVAGYMPRKRNKGFVFTNVTGQDTDVFRITAAHELGHGAFRFDHWWTETGLPIGTTDNLMDYGGGTTLTRRQWEYVRNPQAVNTLAEEDSTALLWWQRKSEDIWRHNINQISCAISRGATSLPIEVSYYVSDGEATYGLRNLGGVGLFGLELDLDVYALPENGVHTLDLSSLSIARGATTSTLRFSFSSGTTYLEFEAVNEDFATFETIIQNGSDAYFQGLVAAIPSEKSDDAYSSLVTLPDCSLELISTQERIKYLQWLADEWITNGDEEILIVRLLKVGLPASKSEALLDVLRTQPQLLKELYRTTEIRRDQFSNALVEHWQSVRTATNKYQGVEVYFNLTQGLWDKVADKIDYSEDGRSLIFIDASTYQDIYSRGNVQYYVERVQYQEVFSSAPFDPVLVRLPGTDSTLTLPALAVKNFTDAENRQATIQSVMAGIELGLLFMGVGEVTAGIRALQAARAVNSTYKLTRAAVSLALGVGDLTVTAVSGVCDYGGSIDTTQFCSTWNDYKIYLEAGLLTGSVLDVFVSSLKRQGSDLLARGNLEADTERTLRDLVEESADDILAELDAATAALLRNNITNAGQLKRVANKIKSLGEYRDDFLRDLTRRPGNVTTTPPGSNYLADNIGSLDEDILDTWKTLRDANKLPDKRTDFGFLEANKGKTVDELVQQNARARLADQLEPSCPGCAKAIRSSGRLGQRVRTDLIQKIRNGEKPDGLSETWEEVYTKFHSTEELDAFGYSNGTMDWDGFFSANKYQGHHLDPVNLFADENGAFRFMFENIPEDRLEELIEFFNSLENGILVPNKRIVNGVERVIHSNHDLYETQIADFLDRKKAEFSALNSNDELIAEDLFDLLREKNLEFEKKIIQESLLDHSNINSINLRL